MHSSSSPFVLHARPSHPSWLDYCNYTWRSVQVTELFSKTPVTSSLFGLNIGDAFQLRKVAANILNKQSQTVDNGWSSSLGVGIGKQLIVMNRFVTKDCTFSKLIYYLPSTTKITAMLWNEVCPGRYQSPLLQ
jgi:hypothetical protein